jgi:hypothetical protein
VTKLVALCLLSATAAAQPAAKTNAGSGVYPCPGDERSNVPIACRGKLWLFHVPYDHEGQVAVSFVRPPDSLMLVYSGTEVPFSTGDDGTLRFSVPKKERAEPETVVAARWDLERWEKDIRKMEADAPEAPEKPILFVGSSSIRMWDLKRYFPDLPVLNHGFGGSEYFDALCYTDRIIIPFRPRAIVVYDGDNDIANGKTPEWVLADMKALVCTIHHALPDTPIIVLSIKTSLARWEKHERMEKANTLMAAFAKTAPQVTFLDMNTPLLDTEGRPDPKYFVDDKLHLNHDGYTIWTRILRPVLGKALETD